MLCPFQLPYHGHETADPDSQAGVISRGCPFAGISDVRDESDRDGMRVVVEVKRGSSAAVTPLCYFSCEAALSCF